jgi:hypothetical protein
MERYKFKQRYGIDDLKSLFAFHGNSQGDETRTNSIELYKLSEGWLSFVFDCELTEEAIFNEIESRVIYNNNYISKLKESGKYGIEYEVIVNLQENPLLDNNYPIKQPIDSYKMILLDLSK